jgi:HlyD family secretion protein
MSQRRHRVDYARGLVACTVATLLAALPAARAENATGAKAATAGRGVAALGRLEPEGGIHRIGLPSTPEAISGAVVTRILVQRGQDVQAGQVLAEADTVPVLKAEVAGAKAALETTRREARAAVSEADEACVRADVAARQSKRQNELLARKLTSDDIADQFRGAAEAGAASCKARRASASVAESRIAVAEQEVARRQAEFERAFARAPFAGRIIDVTAKTGETAGAHGIVELGNVSQMYAIAEVYETDIRWVKVGQKARVTSDALSKPITGTVTRIRPKVKKLDEIGTDPAARKDARIIEVEVKLDDSKAVAALSLLQVEVEIGR